MTTADPNPYQAPRADLEPAVPALDANARPATRLQRFFGAVIDAILSSLAHSMIYLGVSRREVFAAGGNVVTLYLRMGLWGHVTGAVVLGLALLQWWLISRRGQSVGKIMLSSRIVRMNGAPVDFVHGVVIRNWILTAPPLVLAAAGLSVTTGPMSFFGAITIIDILLIFGDSKRCFHDRMADTRVIDLAPPTA